MRDGDEEHLNAEPGKKCAVYFFIYDDDDDGDAAFAAIWTESLQRAKRRAEKQEEQQEEKLPLMMLLLLLLLLKVTSSFGAAPGSAYPCSPWYQIDFNDFTCSKRHDAVPPAPTQSTYEYEMQLHGQATTKAANVLLIDKIVARTLKVSLFKRGN